MTKITRYILAAVAVMGSTLMYGATKSAAKGGLSLEEIELMIRHGDLDGATTALDSAAQAQPKNAQIDLLRGKCFVAQNNDSAAIASFESANKKGSNDALLELADIATRQYRVEDAEGYIDDYKAYIAKNKRKKLVDNSEGHLSQLTRTQSMLERVEQIVVFDSINVDKDYFLEAYRLAAEAGSLNYTDVLPSGVEYSEPTVVYITEDGREMIWGTQDENSIFHLLKMDRLADGSWETPEHVGDHLGQDADANYPFLMADGVTLYFASDNEDSLGGLDIFVSRNNGEEFLQPQNIGLPYNSPYDDYMLAIDELTGVGFWASNRNRLGDKVTVYFFIPTQSRVNVDLDDPTLVQRASLRSIRDTWPKNANFTSLHKALEGNKNKENGNVHEFDFSLPDGRVLTRFSQFNSDHAADLMEQYTELQNATDKVRKELEALRIQYGNGDTSVAGDILQMEKDILEADKQLKRVANDIIRAESGGNLK